MKLTELESRLNKLDSPYAISIKRLEKARDLKIDLEKLLEELQDENRVSAIVQLFICDYEADKKLFTPVDVAIGLNTEIKLGDLIYDSPYILPEIPSETIIYYSRYNNYKFAPETVSQLYNDIARYAREEISQSFLYKMLTSPNLDTSLLISDKVYNHLEAQHVNTEREKIKRVLSDQKPGVSIVTVNIPSPDEFVKETGKEFIEEEYLKELETIFEKANEKVSAEQLHEYIREAIRANIDKILFWYKTNDHAIFEKEGGDAAEISIKYDIRKSPFYKGTPEKPEYIGSGYDLNLCEKYTPILKIPLRKDKFAPLGIHAKTLYPDILDKEAVFSGKTFDINEANIIAREVAIENSFVKQAREKADFYVNDTQNKASRPLNPSEIDLIRESDAVKLTEEEKEKIIEKVDETFQGLDFLNSPIYKAFARIKADFTDKKIVAFFGNFKDVYRIEITPETFANRSARQFHRCVILFDKNTKNLRYTFFQTERAAGYDGRTKIKRSELTADEKEIFKYCLKVVNEEIEKDKALAKTEIENDIEER